MTFNLTLAPTTMEQPPTDTFAGVADLDMSGFNRVSAFSPPLQGTSSLTPDFTGLLPPPPPTATSAPPPYIEPSEATLPPSQLQLLLHSPPPTSTTALPPYIEPTLPPSLHSPPHYMAPPPPYRSPPYGGTVDTARLLSPHNFPPNNVLRIAPSVTLTKKAKAPSTSPRQATTPTNSPNQTATPSSYSAPSNSPKQATTLSPHAAPSPSPRHTTTPSPLHSLTHSHSLASANTLLLQTTSNQSQMVLEPYISPRASHSSTSPRASLPSYSPLPNTSPRASIPSYSPLPNTSPRASIPSYSPLPSTSPRDLQFGASPRSAMSVMSPRPSLNTVNSAAELNVQRLQQASPRAVPLSTSPRTPDMHPLMRPAQITTSLSSSQVPNPLVQHQMKSPSYSPISTPTILLKSLASQVFDFPATDWRTSRTYLEST